MTVTRLPHAGTEDHSWTVRGACAGMDPDEFFVQGAEQHRVKAACGQCPVRLDCLVDALDNRMEFGVWGGMTERERRRLLRQRPDITSWRALVERSVLPELAQDRERRGASR